MCYKLKPCPFCGGEAIFSISSNISTHTKVAYEYTIKCSQCGCTPIKQKEVLEICMCPHTGELYATGESQVKQSRMVGDWNTRTQQKGGAE